ncbi:RimK family alpha-L-glutamate ligase [Fretibacter rubidus]|uniref:ATP-grasp domain-containing protein n=1 Tax=Fretibacter rubidus TaxID=570162 RepID=UPI00352B6F28
MKKIAILASDNMMPDASNQRDDSFERDEQMGKIVPAFATLGMTAELIRWREASARADEFDAMLPLLVWDYFEGNEQAFLSEMAKAEQKTKIFNPFSKLKWNANKSYLDELEHAGAPVIETITVDGVTPSGITKAFAELRTDTVVIKPQVGGGAWRQVLLKQGEPMPARSELPPQGAMIQAFLPSVKSEGEYSFLYFGGQFSHGLIKRPKDGDYRIQSLYGGTEESYTPTKDERAAARAVLDALDFTPLYARVDLIRGLDGQLKLIELEMIEPYLYLSHAEGEAGDNKGALKLGAALLKKLG